MVQDSANISEELVKKTYKKYKKLLCQLSAKDVGVSMELIQNPVYNREGKKWKQRWATLKRVSPKTSQATKEDIYLYVFLYKSQQHAVEGKEKLVLPLIDFCGAEARKQYDKANNVLVLITSAQTLFFSFETGQIRDQWMDILEDQYGKAVTYNINIPDKQKRKYGESTIRIYRSFFSITNRNYKCLNRWFANDIQSFSAEGDSQFMFEIGPRNKSKGLLVNILVPNNAVELVKTFEFITAELDGPAIVQRDFTGSSVLIDLEQSKRNAGDRNFIRRAILRASDRLRKKHRDRSRSAPMSRKYMRSSKSMNDSMSDEAKFCSLDRRKSPDIGVQLNEDTKEKTISILRSVSSPGTSPSYFSRQISADEPAPPVPKKKSPTSSSSSQQPIAEHKRETSSVRTGNERTLLKGRSMTINDIPTQHNMNNKIHASKSEDKIRSDIDSKPISDSLTLDNEASKKLKLSMTPTDKSEITKSQPRRSTDGVVNNNYKQPANPAQYAISKTKRIKPDENTPTPPPRSPASLGLSAQTAVFNFSTSEEVVNDNADGKESEKSLLTEIDKEVKRRTMHSEDLSDDAFASSEPSPLHFDYSNVDFVSEPAYRNIDHLRKDSSDDNSQNLAIINRNRRPYRRSKHLSDPLSLEAWSQATGEGKQIVGLQHFSSDRFDYINVKSNTPTKDDDSDHGSYVNVTAAESGKPEIVKKGRKNIPEPLKLNRPPLRSYKNEFEKYDDDDSSIYHAVGVFDDCSSSTNSIITRRAGGSYENMNLKSGTTGQINHKSDYLNLMSPMSTTTPMTRTRHMNYAILPDLNSKSVSTSPIRGSTRSPIEKPNKSDYTLIDEVGTNALANARTKHEHNRQTRDKQPSSGNKTPTKSIK